MPAIRGSQSKSKTRRRKRDLDQIHADLHDEKHLKQYHETKAADDLPAGGQWYCTTCAKWFDGEYNWQHHLKGKPHKRMERALQKTPYSQKEAEAAIGLQTDNGKPTTEPE